MTAVAAVAPDDAANTVTDVPAGTGTVTAIPTDAVTAEVDDRPAWYGVPSKDAPRHQPIEFAIPGSP